MADTDAVGRLIGGRYRLLADLGSGGFGRVWKAHDQALNVNVAIKEVWLTAASSPEEQAERLARATREARNAAQLRDHPNIVAVHDVVVEHDIPWIVMQLVDGDSLEHRLATQGPLSVGQATQVATALLKALEAADQAGILHRDVKPGNVLITVGGQVLLTDFGIAVHQADTRMTSTGMIIGSMEYIAPERINGQNATIASDLFSLGVTLYQAVEGISPFRGESPATTLNAVLSKQLPPPQPAGRLAQLITRLLEKRPANRPSIPEALSLLTLPPTALEQPADHRPPVPPTLAPVALPRGGTAYQPASPTSAQQPSSQSRRRFLIGAGGATAVGAATAVWLLILRPAVSRPSPNTGIPPAGTFSQPTPWSQPLTGHTGGIWSVAFSPDGRTLASGSVDRTIRLWDLTNAGQPVPLGRALTGDTSDVTSVAFSPDGHTLASGSYDNTVRLWDLTDPSQPASLGRPLTAHKGGVDAVVFAPDGHTLISGAGDSTIRLWDLTNQSGPEMLTSVSSAHAAGIWSVALSSDGHALATGSGDPDNTVRLWDLTNPSRPTSTGPPLNGHNGGVTSVAFSSDGRILASASEDHTVRLWDLTNPGQPTSLGPPLTGHTDTVHAVAFFPDGHILASGSYDTTVRLWDLTNPGQPTSLGQPLTGHNGGISSVAFSPDGHILASGCGDTTIRLWDLTGRNGRN